MRLTLMDLKPFHRYRTRLLPDVYSDFVHNCIIGCTSAVYGPTLSAHGSEEMWDTVTPNYKQRIAAGEIINNACTYTKSEHSRSGDGYSHHTKTGGGTIYEQTGDVSQVRTLYLSDGVWDGLDPPIVEDQTKRAKLLAIANIDSTPYAFGEDAGEIRETIKFLTNPMSSLLKLSRSFKKKKTKSGIKGKEKFSPRNAAQTAQYRSKLLAETWLEYRFAASPLVRSLMDGLEAYSSTLETLPPRLSARGKAIDTDKVSGDLVNNGYTFERDRTRTFNNKASILYEVSNPIYDWKYRYGFRAKDLPTTLWQLLPYSFMIDRLFDVTHFCQGVINLTDPNVKILSACSRVKEDWEDNYRCSNMVASGWSILMSGEIVTEKYFRYNRIPWSPSYSDTVPSITLDELVNSATKLLDLTALVYLNFAGEIIENLIFNRHR
jgi:hypothetical protein